jgi:hypothetical protein
MGSGTYINSCTILDGHNQLHIGRDKLRRRLTRVRSGRRSSASEYVGPGAAVALRRACRPRVPRRIPMCPRPRRNE